jgi:5-methylcytosine-specific restriction endonuclease McrA
MQITIETVISSMPKNSRGNDGKQKKFLISQTSNNDRGKKGNLLAFCSDKNWQDAATRAADAYFVKVGVRPPDNVAEKIGYGLIALAGQNPHYNEGWMRYVWEKNPPKIKAALEAAVIAAGDIALLIDNLRDYLRLKLSEASYPKMDVDEGNYELIENSTSKVTDNIGSPRDIENKYAENTNSNLLNSDSVAARAVRLKLAPKIPEKYFETVEKFKRNPDVVDEVLYRARGICSHCNMLAPFNRSLDGSPYLEVHHITPLSQGGEDTVENAIALCPNCHRKVHFG